MQRVTENYDQGHQEPAKSHKRRFFTGFFDKYMSGEVVLDIGFGDKPVIPNAIGVELGYKGYDGLKLPFEDGSVDCVFSSHCIEHIPDSISNIKDWFRVLKTGGFIVCIAPHQYLYEKRQNLPSKWNPDHKRFYTPSSLLKEFEDALEPNTYRVRHFMDVDANFDYNIPPERHSKGCFEMELVIEKIVPPSWKLIT